MRGFKEKGFNDKLETAAKAKQAQLERARAKSPLNDPDFARRQAERKRQEGRQQPVEAMLQPSMVCEHWTVLQMRRRQLLCLSSSRQPTQMHADSWRNLWNGRP